MTMQPRNKLIMALGFIAITVFTVLIAGCSDDPFYPRPPQYTFAAQVTGLEGFTTDNGTAVIMLPLLAWNGTPVRPNESTPFKGRWLPGYYDDNSVQYHGMTSVTVVNTSFGPMVAVNINMTDYYMSYAKATPIAVEPGQNLSTLPTIVPERVEKNLSFEDINLQESGYASPWGYVVEGKLPERQEVLRFVETPLLPAVNRSGTGNYTSYVYIDERLLPLKNGNRIHVLIRLKVMLNHNTVDASVEGTRTYEYHDYTINGWFRGGMTGFVPVQVEYKYHTSTRSESSL